MASVTAGDGSQTRWWIRLFTHDYCPVFNPYVYWLREPIGWFVLAAAASAVVGAYLSPIGWSLAVGLVCIIVVGLIFPWISVRAAQCSLACETSELQEEVEGHIVLTVQNRWPFPLCGLMIQGFLVNPSEDSSLNLLNEENPSDPSQRSPTGDIGLASVPWLSRAQFRLPVTPRFRGRYPLSVPEITCSFPFGLWTARRPMNQVQGIVVHPRRVHVQGMLDLAGNVRGETGHGDRVGGHGDFLGVRPFRRGDAIRSIHWQHTARLDTLVVCERGSPERIRWSLELDPSRCTGSKLLARQNLAWRVRIAASLATLMSQQGIAFDLNIHGESQWHALSSYASSKSRSVRSGMSLANHMDRLTDVPLDGVTHGHDAQPVTLTHAGRIAIRPVQQKNSLPSGPNERWISLTMEIACGNARSLDTTRSTLIDIENDIAYQLNDWLRKVEYGSQVA